MVIQESLVHGRPLIVSDIGGMDEKVTVLTGLKAQAANPTSWANVLVLATDAVLHERLRGGISKPLCHADCANGHIELIRKSGCS